MTQRLIVGNQFLIQIERILELMTLFRNFSSHTKVLLILEYSTDNTNHFMPLRIVAVQSRISVQIGYFISE